MWYGSVAQICGGCFMSAGITFHLSLGREKVEQLSYVWERYFISLSDFKVPVESFVVFVAKDGWMDSTWPRWEKITFFFKMNRIQNIVSVCCSTGICGRASHSWKMLDSEIVFTDVVA